MSAIRLTRVNESLSRSASLFLRFFTAIVAACSVLAVVVATTLSLATLWSTVASISTTGVPNNVCFAQSDGEDDDDQDDDDEDEDDEDDDDGGLDDERRSITLTGLVRSELTVEEGEDQGRPLGILIVANGKKIEADLRTLPASRFFKHEPIALSAVPSGRVGYVLGRKQEETRDPESNYRVPPQIISVTAFLVCEGGAWTPPPLSKKQAKSKLKWLRGSLQNSVNATTLDGVNIQFGRQRKVVQFSRAAREDVKKGTVVQVTGIPDDPKKPTALRVAELVVLTKKMPAREYAPILGDR